MTGALERGSPAIIWAELTDAPIAAADLTRMVRADRCGAVATFEGTVRDHHAGRRVAFLEYEAYVPLAEREMRRICSQAAERWDLAGVAVQHRLGRLEVGDVAVVVAVSAGHRGPAFEALREVVEQLKRTVPIWKRETGPDGAFWIEGPEHVRAAD